MTTRSITSYSLPNRITWREFPEIQIAYQIVNEHLLIDELSDCVISTDGKTSAIFHADGSARIYITIACGTIGENKSLILSLKPDGSYEYEGVK